MGVHRFDRLIVAQIHMDTARQTWIETAHRAHNVDALERVRAVLFMNRRILHRIFIWARRAVNIARVTVPRSRRPRMVVCDFAVADHHVMRKNATHRLRKAAADCFFRHGERLPRARSAGVELFEGLIEEIEAAAAAYAWK